jgi:hypothetical protein
MVAILQRLWGRRWIVNTLIVIAAVVVTACGAEPLTLALAAAVMVVVVVDGVQGWRSSTAVSSPDAVDPGQGFTRVNDGSLTPGEYEAWSRSVRYR